MESSPHHRYLKCAYIYPASSLALLALVMILNTSPVDRATPSRGRTAGASPPARAATTRIPVAQARLVEAYGNLPLSFEVNQGQAESDVKFLSRGIGYTLLLTGNEAILALQGRSQKWGFNAGPMSLLTGQLFPATNHSQPAADNPALLRLKLVGANPSAAISGLEELPGKSHYFLGNNPAQWRANVANYSKVKYESVYPGVDLIYYGNQRQLEYDFVVAPGADPRVIALDIAHASSKSENMDSNIDAVGDLVIAIDGGEVRFHKPVVYQEQSAVDSRQSTVSGNPKSKIQNRKSIDGRYVLLAENRVGFEVGAYDRTRPLVIDPELSYSTYLGGTEVEVGFRIAVDGAGSAYITGAAGPNFPTTAGAYRTTLAPLSGTCYVDFSYSSVPCPDAFVTKLSADGTSRVYSTYLGGSRADFGLGIGVDSSGSVYVTGSTASNDFPTTAGVLQTTGHGMGEIFVAKLNAAGSALSFSTFLGGSNDDIALSSALDSSGNTYITGLTFSSDFATTGAYRTSLATGTCTFNYHSFSCPDAFVAKLNNTGTAPLGYATYLGGGSYDAGLGIAVDGSGNAYVTGTTMSSNFPLAGPAQGTTSGGECGPTQSIHPCSEAFVTKLNAAGSGLGYSTYLGGAGDEIATSVAVDTSGSAYVAGITNSGDFPVTDGAAQAGFGGGACGSAGNTFNCPDAFVVKLNAAGSSFGYASYLGGASYDVAFGIAVNSVGNAYVVGATGSIDFPTANPIQGTFGGGSCSFNGVALACPNAFLTKLNAAGSAPAFSTYLGGAGGDIGFGVAVDALGNAYLTGETVSADFPKANPLQTNLGGQADVFIAKMSTSVIGPGAQLTPNLWLDYQLINSTSAAKTATLTNNGDAVLNISGVEITGTNASDFSQTNDCGASLAPSANCSISVTFKPTATGDRAGILTVTDNGPGGSQSIGLAGTGTDVSIAPASGSTTSAEVAAGATATYNLTFTPDGFSGTLALTCTGAPTAAICTPSPASLSLDGTTVANVTVTVTTTARSMAAPPITSRRAPPPVGALPWRGLGWLALAILAGAVAIHDRRARLRGLALGMALLLALLWAACSRDIVEPTHGTPAGTYPLTLTGTAGTATRSTSLTLKVN